ncbi:MAG: CvpA family protein [Eubacteriales bacterium]|nr:CvpA family protein [Eubacteriales bacterium]
MIIDIIIAIVFVIYLIRGWRKGGLYSIGLALALVLAFVLASNLSGLVAEKTYNFAKDQGLFANMENQITTDLKEGETVNQSLDNLGLPEAYQKIIGSDGDGIVGSMLGVVEDLGAESKRQADLLASQLTSNLIFVTIKIVAFLLIFFLSFILLKALLRLLSKAVNALPLIGVFNRALGLLIGFALAILITGTLLSLLPGLQANWPGLERALAESKLATVIRDSKLYYAILDTIF